MFTTTRNSEMSSLSKQLTGTQLAARLLTKVGEIRRLIKGFRTSYRRLKWDAPGSTLTMNSGVISSDMKGHPDQNRVLSLKEIRILATIDNRPGVEYPWNHKYEFPNPINPRLVRQVIGESIPPLAMATIS